MTSGTQLKPAIDRRRPNPAIPAHAAPAPTSSVVEFVILSKAVIMAGFRVKNPEETSSAGAHLRDVLDQFIAETCSASGCLISESQSEIVSVP